MAHTVVPAGAYKVDFNGFTYSGYCPESVEWASIGEASPQFCQGVAIGVTVGKLGEKLKMVLVFTSASIALPTFGSVVSLTHQTAGTFEGIIMDEPSISFSDGATKLNMTLTRYTGLDLTP